MKSLTREYNKKFVQILKMHVMFSNDSDKLYYNFFKHNAEKEYIFLENKNLIGFIQEIFDPQSINFRNNFYKNSHYINERNRKLHKKYPWNVKKSNYKEWLKMYIIDIGSPFSFISNFKRKEF